MVKKIVKQVSVFLASLFLCAVIILGVASANIINAFAAEASNDDTVLYLSDTSRIKHDKSSFSLGNTRLWMAPSQKENIPNKVVQAKIEGAWYTFEYGVYAHANSIVTFNISEFSNKYKYFSAYAGLTSSASKSDGVLVRVDFSQDGKNWTTDPAGNTPVTTNEAGTQFVGFNQDFIHLTYDVTGVKWIRLFANKNGSDAADQVLWTDAKLTTTKDAGEAVMPIEAYDEQIKAKVSSANLDDKQENLFADKDLEKLVLQREFVSRVGQYALKKFRSESADNVAMLEWLLNDLDSLREFMLGGAPFKGNYYNSLTVLSNLYKSYKKDLTVTTKLNNKFMPDRTFGELCRTMMFSVALTHDGTIGSYLQGGKEVNQSKPNRRYAIYKYLYQTERFVATRNSDGSWNYETMNLFGSLRVEEMRWIMSNIIDDESIIWLNDYVQTRINAAPKNAGNLHTPHSYVRYTDPNYNNPVFYAEENKEYFNTLFQVDGRDAYINGEMVENNAGKKIGMWDTKYIVPAGEGEEPYEMTITRSAEGAEKIQKVWMNFNNKFKTGSVCGGISKSGCNIRGARGIPANVIGQPGHAAILYYSKDANGNGSWKIDNDVGGWVAATKNERHLLGWGNETWHRNSGGGGTVVFFHLAQECLNDYDNFVKAEEYTWLAKVFKGDLDRQEKLYEKALTAQVKNLDAWYGLVQTYKAKTNKTANDFGGLANRIGTTLWNHPMAMNCLFKLFTVTTGIQEVDAALTSPVFTTQLKTIELEALTKAKSQGSSAAKSKVNLILGAVDTAVADFSFDGENAGCIVWSDTYSDGAFTWKYSLDGKKTWKEVTFNPGDSHAYLLPEEDLAAISTDNDIYVYIVGASPDNAYRIDVAAKPAMPDTLYANDFENRVIGVDGTYEWRYCERIETETGSDYKPTTGWISYANASPDCSGDKAIEVRLKGTAKKPASDGRIFTFTADNDTDERKYISVSYLSVVDFSTQSQDAKRPNYAVNAIDGNSKTYWHTDYAISIKNPGVDADGNNKPYAPAFITVKLDVPRWISSLEFVQYQYNTSFSIFAKSVTVYVSEDGENWKEAGKRENFENIDDLKAVHFTEPVYGQYVKLVMTDLYETNKNDGVFTTVSMINLYEDTTKKLSPDGEKMPSLSEVTPSDDKFSDLGGIIDEEQASQYVPPSEDPKSNVGLVIALSVVGGGILIAGGVAAFFFVKHKGIIGKKTASKTTESKKTTSEKADSKKTASTKTDSKTTESKKTTSEKADGKKTDSKKTDSKTTESKTTNSKKTNSTKTDSKKNNNK